MYGVYTPCFWQGNHQIYGHIWCTHTYIYIYGVHMVYIYIWCTYGVHMVYIYIWCTWCTYGVHIYMVYINCSGQHFVAAMALWATLKEVGTQKYHKLDIIIPRYVSITWWDYDIIRYVSIIWLDYDIIRYISKYHSIRLWYHKVCQ